MFRTMLKGKIHRATVTEANLEYEGSIAIDKTLLGTADILPYEKVQVVDLTNGTRLETYAIEADQYSGTICINGAAARLVQKGDEIIIMSFARVDENEASNILPSIVRVDERNQGIEVADKIPTMEEC